MSTVERFRARGFAPGGFALGGHTDMASLPPMLRALLVTDGTVTKILEAFFWEPIKVENLGQDLATLDRDIEALEAKRGAEVLKRRVRLVGESSGRAYAYAESLLRLERLPDRLREDIRAGRIGIGELLRERGLETYRELLEFGAEPVADLAATLDTAADDTLIHRVYRIAFHHQPVILITEKFPLSLYEGE